MELKKALAVCLISFCSATLVLLIARALDVQAVSRLEPQLARIVEELEAIRRSGSPVPSASTTGASQTRGDYLAVYYFHSNFRCPTCRAIESQSHRAVQTDFASELAAGELVWKVLNYEEPAGAELRETFEVQVPVVVLARMKDGQIDGWKRLDKVWALVDDQPAFTAYVRDEISRMLSPAEAEPGTTATSDSSELPLPEADASELPVPTASTEIPLPE